MWWSSSLNVTLFFCFTCFEHPGYLEHDLRLLQISTLSKARSEHETPRALRGPETEYGPQCEVPGELQ